MKRSGRGPGAPSGLLAGLILALAPVLATARAAGCGPAAPTSKSAPPTGQPHDHSASPARSESCGGACASASGAGASPRQPVLSAVQFVSASVGWVVGSDRIMHPADGGRRWAVQFRTSQANQLRTVDFVDASHGWVTGTSELLTTTDGGAHWRALPEPCKAIGAVHFVSPDVGFAMACGNLPAAGAPSGPPAGGAGVRPTDAGQHWQPVATPPGVQSVCFSGTRRGGLGADGNIYGTVNGGRGRGSAPPRRNPAGGPP